MTTPVPGEHLNQIIHGSAAQMQELPDECVQLVVTSPPYNVGKEYEELLSMADYLEMLQRVWSEVRRVLAPGGRVCINVANLGRNPYIPLHMHITQQMLALRFLMRGEIIWDKSASAGPSTAWGSWMSASNPALRDTHEYILVFSKDAYQLKSDGPSTIARDDFLEWTKSVWSMRTASAKQIGHPAPFPVELPRRLIQLYSFKDDVVLDPFMGSGQTAIAAIQTGRRFVGYELHAEYVQHARNRLASTEVYADYQPNPKPKKRKKSFGQIEAEQAQNHPPEARPNS